ncbi:hypothetical protein PF005_g13140 [Phytophthora fragariae]|uniref:RxLR effector protein n=1 Tax=Phytophthora fragariae TaxID=53985 RepID=A0A6A3ENN4_9STRA|nr:hypothetical protein PF003_g32567 [Phytophthora fragariae]KAE8935062.1 hypothetical protein PF009_g14977 [Phytophthora fragariae]KAE9055688.1 hypothetical protein PF007_g32234 [Phytophthora fragariae]KAE9103529.1 hypothetical protein PF010_g13702 [Phytophthora fragariae]KAE9141568.1 hypothetical protein PF006_g13138 [Phytophthora fragariae]
MRVHYFALAAAVLVASSVASTESKWIARRLTDDESFPTKRLLRTHKISPAAEEEKEERGVSVNMGFVDDIAHNVQVKALEAVDSTQAKLLLDGLMNKGTHPECSVSRVSVPRITCAR